MLANVSVLYSNTCPFSQTNKYCLLAQGTNGFMGLYDSGFNLIEILSNRINTSSFPMWSRKIESLIYFIEYNTNLFFSYDVISKVFTQVFKFNDYIRINNFGEGDISIDGEHFALCGIKLDGTKEVFTFDNHTKQITDKRIIQGIDGLKISTDNRWVVSNNTGLFTSTSNLTKYNGHAALTKYKDKNLLLWCSANEPIINANAVVKIDINNVKDLVILKKFDPVLYSFHIAVCDKDYCFVSTDCPSNKLKSQIWRVYYDGREAVLLYEFQNVYRDYQSQLKAAVSRDGSRIVFCRDDGKQVYLDYFLLNDESYSGFKEIKVNTEKRRLIELNNDGTFREFEAI